MNGVIIDRENNILRIILLFWLCTAKLHYIRALLEIFRAFSLIYIQCFSLHSTVVFVEFCFLIFDNMKTMHLFYLFKAYLKVINGQTIFKILF